MWLHNGIRGWLILKQKCMHLPLFRRQRTRSKSTHWVGDLFSAIKFPQPHSQITYMNNTSKRRNTQVRNIYDIYRDYNVNYVMLSENEKLLGQQWIRWCFESHINFLEMPEGGLENVTCLLPARSVSPSFDYNSQ